VDVDLRKKVQFRMGGMKADLVHGCRFLCRELFPEIREDVLLPGGVFIWSHFIEGCELYAPPLRCASPSAVPSSQKHRPRLDIADTHTAFVARSPSRQLSLGELHECFIQDGDFLQLHDEEGQMGACPPPQSREFMSVERLLSVPPLNGEPACTATIGRTRTSLPAYPKSLISALGSDTVATPLHQVGMGKDSEHVDTHACTL
jgi:hypothetical protein